MKVLHVIPSIAQVRGGPSQAILEMVRALQVKGVEAEIVTTNDNGTNLLDVPLQRCIDYEGVATRFFSRFSPKVEPIREFAFSGQLTGWLWQNICKYDLLHVHAIFSYPSTIAMTIARLQRKPYLVRPLGQLCQWSLQQSHRKKQVYLKAIERSNLKGSQALHLTSRQEETEVSQLNLKVPNFILPHGLSIPDRIPDAPQKLRQLLKVAEDETVILFMSRVHPKKGLDYLIPALAKLDSHSFTFVIAGNSSPEYESELDTLLNTLGIKHRIHRFGFVSGEIKNILLQGADLFALTSHSENFGVAVLEALAAGLPVLVTPGVALASVVAEHQLGYVAEMDIDAIASEIEHFLNNRQEAKAMGQNARQLVRQEYTWNSIATRLIDVYSSTVEPNLFSYSHLMR
jgi:glycosyltransferase involved in cell wall biosynthesis